MKNQYEIRGDIVVIFLKLKNGDILETIIDLKDFEKVNSFPGTWHAIWWRSNNSYYVSGHIKKNYKQTNFLLHRFLFDNPKGKEVDHINHQTLDNRRMNLRLVTSGENHQNRKGANKNSKTGILGVSWDKKSKKWCAEGKVNKKRVIIGYFSNIEDAALAREKWEIENMPFSTRLKAC